MNIYIHIINRDVLFLFFSLSLHLISLRSVHTYMHMCVCVSMNVCAFESLMSLEYVSCIDVKMCHLLLLGLFELRHAKCPLLLLLLSDPRWPHASAQTSFAKHFQIQITKYYQCSFLLLLSFMSACFWLSLSWLWKRIPEYAPWTWLSYGCLV